MLSCVIVTAFLRHKQMKGVFKEFKELGLAQRCLAFVPGSWEIIFKPLEFPKCLLFMVGCLGHMIWTWPPGSGVELETELESHGQVVTPIKAQ